MGLKSNFKKKLYFWICFALFISMAKSSETKVIINGVNLKLTQVELLETAYKVKIKEGRFWYDTLSGLWGLEGGPTLGQILPGLKLGGPLLKNSSGKGSGVFINGREVHSLEKAFLKKLFGFVRPGRYWLNGKGYGGAEGGPALFNLKAMMNGHLGKGWLKRTAGGSLGGNGSCSYYNHPNGSSVMIGQC